EREISDRESLSEETIGPESLASNQNTQIYFTQIIARIRTGTITDPEEAVVLKTPTQRKTREVDLINLATQIKSDLTPEQKEALLEQMQQLNQKNVKFTRTYQAKGRKEIQELIDELEQELERLESGNEKIFPIKNFLLEKSLLVQFEAKEASGKELTKAEQARERRIFQSREKAFANIQKELAKYYETVTNGNYRFAGMPKIRKGIRG
ncbi:1074_t:CDS:2, partial [Paraglomus occultum]